MKSVFNSMNKALKHIEVLHNLFLDKSNFLPTEVLDHELYEQNSIALSEDLQELNLYSELYGEKERQMIISDLYEYIFLGRGYYAMKTREDRARFIRAILHFVNLLMSYESLTVSNNLRKKALNSLSVAIPEVKDESLYNTLQNHPGHIGLKGGRSKLDKYFDSLLPKTAGGLWHELLVFIFLLRNNCGYIVPNLLIQRWMSLEGHIIPPDFLLLTDDKRIFGIEVGTGKERQSGTFTLQTAIPTVSVNTIDARASDRCPSCNKWIQLCPYVIENYSDLNVRIGEKTSTVYCLEKCTVWSKEEIIAGRCPYTKYKRAHAKTIKHANHPCANGYHYHYQCVLNTVSADAKGHMINAYESNKDTKALLTHFPYYSGLEVLIQAKEAGYSVIPPIEAVDNLECDSDETEDSSTTALEKDINNKEAELPESIEGYEG